MAFNMDDYVDVATRIGIFREKHPEGSLQPADPAKPYEVLEIDGKTFLVVVAAAYRTPDDLRPGIGMAQEPFPGTTNYTRNSELMNAESSAWGRAIVAALAADTKPGIASADEVRNRRAEQDTPTRAPRKPAATKPQTDPDKARTELRDYATAHGLDLAEVMASYQVTAGTDLRAETDAEAIRDFIAILDAKTPTPEGDQP